MYNNTKKVLEMIFKKEYNMKNPVLSLRELVPKNQLVIVDRGHIIINQGDSIEYLNILLKGKGAVINHISWNKDNVVDYVKSIEILGLIEYLNNITSYTAYVVAETNCILFRVPVNIFNHIIQENAYLCYQALLLLGKVTGSVMDRAETYSLFHPKDQLGHYLFKQARYRTPYTCKKTRKELAEFLHLNLRTLYRYLNDMEEHGFISLCHGKIIIEQRHLQNMEKRYGDVIL